jgi:carbamoyl-phosphate synthase large subunit
MKMNLLVTSAGRRTKLLSYFKKEFHGVGKIIATDCDRLAPALYSADKGYLVPRITDKDYIDIIFDICKREEIRGILTLIDPEIELIARHESQFKKMGVKIISPDYNVAHTCFDKFMMYQFMSQNGFLCAKTYISIEDFERAFKKNEIRFPVFIKPRKGSASKDINKINDMDELRFIFSRVDDLLIQEYMDGSQYDVDTYVDLLNHEIISIFIKDKISMRSGEADKAVSLVDDKLMDLIQEFIKRLGLIGPADIDVFKVKECYYISEVNPRFGGNYLLAYECGENYPKYIKNNLMGIENTPMIGKYRGDVFMMKHDDIFIMQESRLIMEGQHPK